MMDGWIHLEIKGILFIKPQKYKIMKLIYYAVFFSFFLIGALSVSAAGTAQQR